MIIAPMVMMAGPKDGYHARTIPGFIDIISQPLHIAKPVMIAIIQP